LRPGQHVTAAFGRYLAAPTQRVVGLGQLPAQHQGFAASIPELSFAIQGIGRRIENLQSPFMLSVAQQGRGEVDRDALGRGAGGGSPLVLAHGALRVTECEHQTPTHDQGLGIVRLGLEQVAEMNHCCAIVVVREAPLGGSKLGGRVDARTGKRQAGRNKQHRLFCVSFLVTSHCKPLRAAVRCL
jgi:hypothetical protein